MIVYWIYFIIFLIAVFIPVMVRDGYGFLPEEQLEQMAILLMGFFGLMLFVAQRKKVLLHIKEKAHFLRETNRMSKDLTSSYSYIGEINRKLDILKNIALGLPEAAAFTPEKEKEIYDLILGAIKVLGKSPIFAIRFVKTPEYKLLKELCSKKSAMAGISTKECFRGNRHIKETDDYVIVTSHKPIENIRACIIIKKQRNLYPHEDLELIEAIASQALFVYVTSKRKNKKEIITSNK